MSTPFRPQYLLPLLIAASLVSCGKKKDNKPKQNPPVIVDVMVASLYQTTQAIEANGTVAANEFVELHPEISGRVTYLNIPEGSFVQQGTVLARINDADLQAQLSKIKAQLALARQTEERYKQLIDVNGINQNDYDIAVNAVSGYQADQAYTQAMIDKTIIRAPFSGKLGLRQVSPGAYVSPSTIIATIQQTDKIKIDFTLPEEYSPLLQTGSMVSVQTGDQDSSTLQAKIIATEPQVIQSSRNLKVRAQLQQGKANPGAFVKVFLNTASVKKEAIMIPASCIIPNDKTKQVVLVRNGKAKMTDIETGDRQAAYVAVTKGLSPGDSVVVTGVLFAKDKAVLKVRSVKTAEISQTL